MATRSYVTPSAYDPADAEFTIATIDGNPYLQMGALGREDAALFRSLIDGYAGFFLNGKRVAAVRITERYDPTNGVQLESLPTLTVGGEYHVRFSQARPGRDGRDGKDGSNRRTGGMQPFRLDSMEGRRYGPMIPFNRYNRKRMLPYSGEPMTGKPSGDPMRGRYPKKRQSGEDILDLFDGVPELVADYMWNLIADRVPPGTVLRDAEQTFQLIRAKLEGYVEGYTEAYTTTEKSKLGLIEDRATRDQSDVEILALLLGLNANQRDSLRNGINAQVAGSYAPGSTISATIANVLTALKGFSDDQDSEARTALDVMQNSREALLDLANQPTIEYEGIATNITQSAYLISGGDYLWFANLGQNPSVIYRVNPTTKEVSSETLRVRSSTRVYDMVYDNGYIWYINRAGLTGFYKINVSTGVVSSRLVTWNQLFNGLSVGDGFIWFYDPITRSARKINPATDTLETERLNLGQSVFYMFYYDRHIYFITRPTSSNFQLNKVNIATGIVSNNIVDLEDNRITYFNFLTSTVVDNFFYFIGGNRRRINRINLTNETLEDIGLDVVNILSIAYADDKLWVLQNQHPDPDVIRAIEKTTITNTDLLNALNGIQDDARLAIQALGRNVTVQLYDRGTIPGPISGILLTGDANGFREIIVNRSNSVNLASGQKGVVISFDGGII